MGAARAGEQADVFCLYDCLTAVRISEFLSAGDRIPCTDHGTSTTESSAAKNHHRGDYYTSQSVHLTLGPIGSPRGHGAQRDSVRRVSRHSGSLRLADKRSTILGLEYLLALKLNHLEKPTHTHEICRANK